MNSQAHKPRTAFIVSEKFGDFKPPSDFPYEMDRGVKILEYCKQHDMIDKPWMSVIEAREATHEDLLLFHTEKYLDALRETGHGSFKPEYLGYGLGSPDCPIFHDMYEYGLLAAGATLTALRALYDNNLALAFNPAGGLHHAGSDKAEGFCYVNDIVIAGKWLQKSRPGIRICYADIDAHHANGVQDAFYSDDTVLTISIHQTGKTIYPGSGFENETGRGRGRGFSINVPLELQSDDDIFMEAFNEVILPAIKNYDPDLLVTQLGVDMLHSDPLTDLNITNSSHAFAAKSFMSLGYPILAVGGGGYRRETYIKTNALLWSIMNGIEDEEDTRGLVGGVLIGDPGVSDVGLREPRRYTIGAEKSSTAEGLDRVISRLKQNIPLLGP